MVLDLPCDRVRGGRSRSGAGGVHRVSLSAEAVRGISMYRLSHPGVSEFMILLAAWQVLLHKISTSGQTDICVGSVSANRYRSEIVPLIGMFVNTLPYRTQIDGKLISIV